MIRGTLARAWPPPFRLAQLPIRLRITLLFAGVMALVLLLIGGFLYQRSAEALDTALDAELETRYVQAAAVLDAPESGWGEAETLPGRDDRLIVQLIDEEGRVQRATADLPAPLLSPDQLARAQQGTLSVAGVTIPGDDDPFRLRAGLLTSVDAVLVVGRSEEDRSESLEALTAQLVVGGPLVLLAGSLLVYLLAAVALRPVESMRRQAEEMASAQADESEADRPGPLPVPASKDELARLAMTLNSLLRRMESSIARERRFVADASHELRSPLAMLRMESELALRRARTNEELQQALRSVAQETERLSRLAEDLLILARLDQGELALASEPIVVSELLTSVKNRFAARAQNEGRDLTVEAAEGLSFRGDRQRLEQALGNLVDNALVHGLGRVVLLGVVRQGVELHVLDEGQGFDPAFASRAWQRFSRADTARSSEGAGLGLAIAGGIAEAHGGRAEALNRSEGGADVFLVLPLSSTV